MTHDQVRPERVHDARGLRERMRRGDREPQLGENRFAALTVLGIFIDEQHQRGESLLIAGSPAATRPITAICPLPFVRHS